MKKMLSTLGYLIGVGFSVAVTVGLTIFLVASPGIRTLLLPLPILFVLIIGALYILKNEQEEEKNNEE